MLTIIYNYYYVDIINNIIVVCVTVLCIVLPHIELSANTTHETFNLSERKRSVCFRADLVLTPTHQLGTTI